MRFFRFLVALAVVTAAAATPGWIAASEEVQPVAFSEEYLQNPENISRGKEIWDEQCKLCHGKTAYPGKAPKLKPYQYKPEFVFKRITKGFRGMPAWEEVYDENDRMAVTAYVMSKDFSN